jgi:hypothetical protein
MFVKIFENALYEGKPSRPNELAVGYYDLAVKTGMVYLGLAELEDISPKNRDLAQRYLDELKVMKQAAQGPQGQPQAAPAAPGGAPAPEAAQPPPAVPAAA